MCHRRAGLTGRPRRSSKRQRADPVQVGRLLGARLDPSGAYHATCCRERGARVFLGVSRPFSGVLYHTIDRGR